MFKVEDGIITQRLSGALFFNKLALVLRIYFDLRLNEINFLINLYGNQLVMKIRNAHLYDQETIEFCKHAKIISNVNRIYIIQLINQHGKCRVNQIVMETGLTMRQVYYQLSVLREMNYITTIFNNGRYFVYPAYGLKIGNKLLNTIRGLTDRLEVSNSKTPSSSNLYVVD